MTHRKVELMPYYDSDISHVFGFIYQYETKFKMLNYQLDALLIKRWLRNDK